MRFLDRDLCETNRLFFQKMCFFQNKAINFVTVNRLAFQNMFYFEKQVN